MVTRRLLDPLFNSEPVQPASAARALPSGCGQVALERVVGRGPDVLLSGRQQSRDWIVGRFETPRLAKRSQKSIALARIGVGESLAKASLRLIFESVESTQPKLLTLEGSIANQKIHELRHARFERTWGARSGGHQ